MRLVSCTWVLSCVSYAVVTPPLRTKWSHPADWRGHTSCDLDQAQDGLPHGPCHGRMQRTERLRVRNVLKPGPPRCRNMKRTEGWAAHQAPHVRRLECIIHGRGDGRRQPTEAMGGARRQAWGENVYTHTRNVYTHTRHICVHSSSIF